MQRSPLLLAELLAASAALCGLFVTSSHADEPPVPVAPGSCARPGEDDRCEHWVRIFNGSPDGEQSSEAGTDTAVSPDGATTFVAVSNRVGASWEGQSHWVLLAMDTQTGTTQWTARLNWGEQDAFPWALTVSPDGHRLFATGLARLAEFHTAALTIAYDADSGAEVWRHLGNGPGEHDVNRFVSISPNGQHVYTAGITDSVAGDPDDIDLVVSSLDARTGAQLWRRTWNGAVTGGDETISGFGVDPGGRLLFVTGTTPGTAAEYDVDIATLALKVNPAGRNSRLAWQHVWDPAGDGSPDSAADLAVDPAGEQVYVTGRTASLTGGHIRVATVALDATTGTMGWRRIDAGETPGFSEGIALAAADGRVYVAAKMANQGTRHFDWETTAYDGATGTPLWATRFGAADVDGEYPADIAATSDGVWVIGKSFDGRTNPLGHNGDIHGLSDSVVIGYDLDTGAQRWIARYNATGHNRDSGRVLAVGGGHVIALVELDYKADLTGTSSGDPNGRENFTDLGIVAYLPPKKGPA